MCKNRLILVVLRRSGLTTALLPFRSIEETCILGLSVPSGRRFCRSFNTKDGE